jgi:hypothetical protein
MADNPVQSVGVTDASERIGFGLLLIMAPILMLGAGFLHPPHGIENGVQYYHAAHDHPTQFYVAHTLFFLSAVLFVPAVVGLARMVHPSHPKAAFWGCILSLMGFIGYGAMDGMDYMAWVAGNPGTGLDPATMQQYVVTALSSPAIMIPVLLIFLLLVIGLCVLAVGTARAGVLPTWLAVLMPVGMMGVAGALAYPVLLVISSLALLTSFGTVGVKLLKAPTGSPSRAAPV